MLHNASGAVLLSGNFGSGSGAEIPKNRLRSHFEAKF